MEGWNGTLKTEWLYHPDNRYHKNLLTADEAKREILEYCNYYNEERIQAKLNYVKRQPDGPTNRHKNDPLVRVGYLLQETA